MRLTIRQLQRYLEHIPKLQAEELMDQAIAGSVAWMDEDARDAVFQQWKETAGFESDELYEKISDEDFRREIRKGL